MNKKAFTLTELIATIVILGVLMTVAIPNVLSIIERNKALNMVEDAKKFITEVEYEVKRDTTIDLPTENGKGTAITLGYLKNKGSTNLDESPYDIKYSNDSFVLIVRYDNAYIYYASLNAIDLKLGTNEVKSNSRGIKMQSMSNLNNGNYDDLILKGSDASISSTDSSYTVKYSSESTTLIDVIKRYS